MVIELELEFDGPFVPHQSGVRAGVARGRGFIFKDKRLKDYEDLVGLISKSKRPPAEYMDCPIRSTVIFSYPHKRFADLDNVYKSTIDGMEGILFTNDKQIYDSRQIRFLCPGLPFIALVRLEYDVDRKIPAVEAERPSFDLI